MDRKVQIAILKKQTHDRKQASLVQLKTLKLIADDAKTNDIKRQRLTVLQQLQRYNQSPDNVNTSCVHNSARDNLEAPT